MSLAAEAINQILIKDFKLSSFRLGQKDIIESILQKKDVIAVLPTGGGKSLCFQLPAVYFQSLVIVISPLIALMKDQVRSLSQIGIASGSLHSGQSDDEKREVFSKINNSKTFILYISPERAQKEGFKNWILNRPIGLFAIDEAHCVSQWGHDFREEYSQLKILKELRPDVPMLALTASATPMVLNDVARNLNIVKAERKIHGFYRPNLYYQVEFCSDDDEKLEFLLQAVKQFPSGRIIIYCGTRKITEEVAEHLQNIFHQVGFYHAGLSSEVRTKTQTQYAKAEIRILVATNAFGMGIDQPDVRLVVHYQMPANIDSLYQEMGRAGRDGNDSTCIMLYSKKDKGLQSYFITSSDAPKNIKDSRWRTLEALTNYSEGSECRHSEILTYYKDSKRIKHCDHCDNCLPNSSRAIRKPAVKTILKKNIKNKKQVASLEMTDKQEIVFQKLKIWRKIKADELDVPAFIIFSDKTLKSIAIKNPKSLDELKLITGIGEQKLDKFGWDLLAEIKY